MSKYIGNIPVPSATQTKTRIVATSEQTSFTTSGEYTPGYIDVFLGGVKLDSTEFTATDGTTVVLASGANTGQIFESISYTTFVVPDSQVASQTGNSGKYLTTDGTSTSWADATPSQTGNSGKYLTTDGTSTSWADVSSDVASQTGNSGKYLTTDGTNTSWGDVSTGVSTGKAIAMAMIFGG